jgi:crotonobetainyl-CoA:carnitine CoA-transferase CaiB-like acyl-CoA transferase
MKDIALRRYRPLRGLRVLSFEAAFSLPAATRVLAELGAEIVRVGRPVGDFPAYTHRTDGSAINKGSVSIDLRNDEGRRLALRLAAKADVVCNNFRPHVMPAAGLGYEALRAARPDIIVLQLTGYGVPGPWQGFPAFGPSVEAVAGMDAAIGGPNDPPMKVGSGVNADQSAGRYTVLAVLMALQRRRETGEGRYIDLSMYEAMTHLLGDQVLGAAATGCPPAKLGNRSALCAPQGIYTCAGEDEWVALSVCSDEQWRTLCDLVGAPSLSRLREAGAAERAAMHDAIDVTLNGWTSTQNKDDLAMLLQRHGVPSAPVNKAADMPFDPQLRFRGAYQDVTHPEPVLGYAAHPHLTLAWMTVGRQRPPLEDAHPEGSDNRPLLRSWLGLTAAEVRRLEQAGALLPVRTVAVTQGIRVIGAPVDAGFAERLGLKPADGPL